MTDQSNVQHQQPSPLPPDNPQRRAAVAGIEQSLPHLNIVGDTYTILLSGKDTAGRFCLIDMHVPPGGGPPPHRHDFEETFTLLEGELEVTFRGEKSIVRAGETINVPANAPHTFRNASAQPVRMLCICSPSGLEEFFLQVGIPLAHRKEFATKLDEKELADFMEKAMALALKYRIEFLEHA